MQITVALTVEIDPAEWALAYGAGDAAAMERIQADVREYVITQVQQSPGVLDTGGTVTLTR